MTSDASGHGLTTADREKLGELAAEREQPRVSEAECAEWRRRYVRDGEMQTEIAADVDWTRNTVHYHVAKKCQHYGDGDGGDGGDGS